MWPPETFLQWKLRALARRGFRVTVVCSAVYDASFSLPGVEMRRVISGPEPLWPIDRSRWWLIRRAIRSAFRLGMRSPRDLLGVIRGLRNPTLHPPHRALSRYRRRPLNTLFHDLSLFCVIAPIVALRPDVVHFEWEFVGVRFLAISEVCPIVFSSHGGLKLSAVNPMYASYHDRLPKAFARAAAVQCVSGELADEAIGQGLNASKIVLLPCGVDTHLFRPRPRHSRGEQLRIISVAYMRWMKGLEFAVLTVRQLLDHGVPARLDMFGGDPLPSVEEPSERGRIEHAIEDLGLADHVFVHDFMPTPALAERYRESDVLLHSSVSEGVPVVILEAMTTALPVVATDVGGVAQVVSDGVTGFLVPAREPATAALALGRLWRDPDLRERLGRAGRERVMSELALDGQMQHLEELYERAVLDGSGRASGLRSR